MTIIDDAAVVLPAPLGKAIIKAWVYTPDNGWQHRTLAKEEISLFGKLQGWDIEALKRMGVDV